MLKNVQVVLDATYTVAYNNSGSQTTYTGNYDNRTFSPGTGHFIIFDASTVSVSANGG